MITRDTNICFPAREVGTLIFDILAHTPSYAPGGDNDGCTIGVEGSFTFTPPMSLTPARAYIGQIPLTCYQDYTGSGGDPDDWTKKCTFRIESVTPWMSDALFNFTSGGRDKYEQVEVALNTGSNLAMGWDMNFDGFDESVFAQDNTNKIEV